MELVKNVFLWGTLAGVIHFVVTGILYQNPFTARLYKKSEDDPGLRKWNSQKKYILAMFLGTQVEVYILSAGYFILTGFIGVSAVIALLTAAVFSGIRVYPRFWNMWIQTTYPRRLLAVEVINGCIGTFVIIFSLYFFSKI